jgi:hypothetical protein
MEALLTFGGLLGILSERPEVQLGLVTAMTVLRNGEDIMTAAAIQVYKDSK